jgi:hypothetical protein
MATTVATAQRREAAIRRVQAAATALGIDPAPLTGTSRDPEVKIAEIFEGIADALEKMTPAAAPKKAAKVEPAPAPAEEAPE